MNPILKNLLDRAEKWQDGNPSPLLMRNIQGEKQDRPLPDDLWEQQDIPYGDPGAGLFADVVYPSKREAEKLPVVVFVHGGALVSGDRKSNRVFCQELARRGFVVYSVEYRLIDKTDAFGMVSDVCMALAMVWVTAERFGGDPNQVSLCAESAGAFLSIYAVAAGKSDMYRRMLGLGWDFRCGEFGPDISHLILISGLIDTTAKDAVGLVYKKALYGAKSDNMAFMMSIAPDNPKMLSLLPPILLVSSKADFLRGNTLNYANALEQNHHEHRLLYYPENKALTHAFPSLLPSLPESGEVIDAIRDWMNNNGDGRDVG